jgi:competence protein ComEA
MSVRTPLTVTIVLLLLVLGGPSARVWAGADAPPRPTAAQSPELVNINTASEGELTSLKGVGPAVAKRIVEYRQTNGEFKKPEDIQKVQGVGKRLWEQNRQRIAVK